MTGTILDQSRRWTMFVTPYGHIAIHRHDGLDDTLHALNDVIPVPAHKSHVWTPPLIQWIDEGLKAGLLTKHEHALLATIFTLKRNVF